MTAPAVLASTAAPVRMRNCGACGTPIPWVKWRPRCLDCYLAKRPTMAQFERLHRAMVAIEPLLRRSAELSGESPSELSDRAFLGLARPCHDL